MAYLHQRESGLVLATDKPLSKPKPPEHPARRDIRDALRLLENALGAYEQTTHGCHLWNGVTIDMVTAALDNVYREPNSYTISTLSQHIAAFLKQEEPE